MEILKPTILNLDDNDAGRYAKSRVLRRAGFEVYEAATGEKALRIVTELKPQVALLDVRLPDINGIEVCRRIKSNPATASIIVVQISATFLDSSDRVKGLEGGADTYLTEPIDAEELVASVRAMLRLRQAEQAVREREAWLSTTLQSIGDAVITTDLEGRVTLINRVAQSLIGWDEEKAKGRPLAEIFKIIDGRTHEESENPVARTLREGRITELTDHTILVDGDGRELLIDATAAPIKDEEDRLIGVVLIFRDITERRRAEHERDRALEREQELRLKAEEASRLKDEFLATVSHELRTPINHMLGWVMMLRGGMLSPTQAQSALETIERNVRMQNRLIEDLLDVSRIISGKLRLEMRPVRISEVIEAAVASARPAAEAKDIILIFTDGLTEESTHSRIEVLGDPDRLQQIVWNLLSNAIKFTPAGETVKIQLRSKGSLVEIVIVDTGEGIDPEFLPYVFDRFRQADGSARRKHAGLGLGLAIVRHLVELHGGEVMAESPGLGQGATFTVKLPLAVNLSREDRLIGMRAIASSDENIAITAQLDGVRVLVVDDEADALSMVFSLLTNQGAEVRTATNMADALATLDNWSPHILVADIGMPDGDGYDLIREIRKRESSAQVRLPAIALTAYARFEDRMRVLVSGFHMHVPKPVEPAELVTVVASLSGKLDIERNRS